MYFLCNTANNLYLVEGHLDSGSSGGADLKCSTLPAPGKFSPEDIFQSEVAHFRWTIREHKNKRKQKVQESGSMVVEVPGSMKRKPQLCDNRGYAMEEIQQQLPGPDFTYRDGGLAAVADMQNLQPTELMLQDDIPGRGISAAILFRNIFSFSVNYC